MSFKAMKQQSNMDARMEASRKKNTETAASLLNIQNDDKGTE